MSPPSSTDAPGCPQWRRPRADLAVYKVCFTVMSGASAGGGSCYTSDSAAAIEQAILDGVDVINFSIGGGTNPYSDAVSLAFLDAYAAGVFVACSAGNDGPGANTVGHREPWTTTVAASTTDKLYYGSAQLTSASSASLAVEGVSAYDGILPGAPVVLSSAAPTATISAWSRRRPGLSRGRSWPASGARTPVWPRAPTWPPAGPWA